MRREMLIIEGDDSVARLFAEIFSCLGWGVDVPRNGRDLAEALLGSKPYAIILISYRFPATNGVEIIRLIREMEHRKDTPVLMVTGSPDVAGEALATGADEVLRKPIAPDRLIAAVRRHASSPDCPAAGGSYDWGGRGRLAR